MRRNAVANRERILVAADRVFGEHGAAGSTEDVARRAGVGVATVFRHFPTKQDLVEAALRRHFDVLIAHAEQLGARPDAGPAFRELLLAMIETGSTKLTLASQLADGAVPAGLRPMVDLLSERVAGLLERAQRAGEIRADVTVAEIYLLVRGLAQASVTVPTEPGTVRRAVDVVIEGLATTTPPGPAGAARGRRRTT